MAVARDYRTPRSKVLGRQAQATTVYHYDDDGRLTHSTTVWEAEWTDEDLDWAIAQAAEDADICPGGCGHHLSETTHPDAEGEYTAPLPTRCHACTPLEQRKEEYRESPPGLLFPIVRKS